MRPWQEPGDYADAPPSPTEHYAIAELVARAARGEDTSKLAAQCAIAFGYAERSRRRARAAR